MKLFKGFSHEPFQKNANSLTKRVLAFEVFRNPVLGKPIQVSSNDADNGSLMVHVGLGQSAHNDFAQLRKLLGEKTRKKRKDRKSLKTRRIKKKKSLLRKNQYRS